MNEAVALTTIMATFLIAYRKYHVNNTNQLKFKVYTYLHGKKAKILISD